MQCNVINTTALCATATAATLRHEAVTEIKDRQEEQRADRKEEAEEHGKLA